jgi:glycosyltransferase involved in cell wall biosynthesis
VFVTQWFPPEPGTVVASSIAEGLAGRGHTVDVLTGFPNYPTGKLHRDFPLKPYRRDVYSEAITVHRAPLYPSHDRSAVKRMANYLSFAASASVVARRHLAKPDAWLTYSSPATSAMPVLTLPRRLQAPSFLLVQDLWPDSVTQSGLAGSRANRAMEGALSAFCSWTYRASDGIGVISPTMRSILRERGVPDAKIHLTPNWVDDAHLHPDLAPSPELRRELGLPDGLLFMYAGNMGDLQGLGPLVEAFALTPSASLVLVGAGVAEPGLRALVARRGIANVRFLPSQPTERIGRFIAASDVQVVSLKDTPLLRATMPSKVQGSMAAGRPILVHGAGDAADLVLAAGAGLACSPGDVTSAAACIESFAHVGTEGRQEMGRRSRLKYLEQFSPQAGLDRLERMLVAQVDDRKDSS